MRLVLGVAALMLLAGCEGDNADSSNEAKAPVDASSPIAKIIEPNKLPAFQATWLPEARGSGNFLVCLDDEAAENDVKNLLLPAGLIFASYGHMAGPLRNAEAGLQAQAKNAQINNQYAVALAEPVRLTSVQPCAKVHARSVTSDGFYYVHETVPVSHHLYFSADTTYLDNKGGISNPAPGAAGDAANMGVIVGTPVADVGDTYAALPDT